MVLHLHHVPGRLRICLQKLKGNRSAIPPLHAELLSIPGVESASLSPHTGSITIFYRRDDFRVQDFWERLRALGYLDSPPETEPVQRKEAVLTSVTVAFGEALASAAVRHLLDRSAGSLIKLFI